MGKRTQQRQLKPARKPGRSLLLRRFLCGSLALATVFGPSGCTRVFFRRQADKEVAEVLGEKDKYPQWRIDQYHIYADPRARFADPTNPDRPPKPPDDPAAYDLSPNPQRPGKAGVARVEGAGYLDLLKKWDEENRASQKEDTTQAVTGTVLGAGAPGATAVTRLSSSIEAGTDKAGEQKPYLLTLEQAVELGVFNSREFQDRREDLYLASLPVTLQRFGFAAQALIVGQFIRERLGSQFPGGPRNDVQFNSTVGIGKLFSTGALLLFRFANQTVINLGGPLARTTSQSTINLDLMQPLLRGGGRAVTLEPLTQTERNLLYQIRSYARFREEFFVSIAGGGGGSISGGTFQPQGVIAPIPFSPSAGLGNSGLAPGIIGVNTSVQGNLQLPGGSGRLNLATALAPNVSGYIGTALEHSQIALDESNIANLEYFLKLFEGFKEGGDVSQLQVDQIEQQLLRGRTNLLTDQQQYLDAIDRFKLQLGLPTELPLALDETPLRPISQQFGRYDRVFKEFGAAGKEAADLVATPAERLRSALRRLFTSSAIVQGTRFRTEFPSRWAAWERLSSKDLTKRLEDLSAERLKLLDTRTDLEKADKPVPVPLDARVRELAYELDIGTFELTLRQYESQPWAKEANPARRQQLQTILFRTLANQFTLVLGEARAQRLDELRKQWPDLPRLCVSGTDLLATDLDAANTVAAQAALTNRLDLMNVRAQLVDAWRQIAVFANALLGTLNIEYHLESFTPPLAAKPFDFAASRTSNQLVINGELPLVRKVERNNYRAALIAYQRQRRALMEAEDLVVQVARGDLRALRQAADNYTIQKRQIELAYETVENSLDTFQAPPQPNAPTNAANAAALTQQLLSAQANLLQSQNAILAVWVNYLNTRFQLYRDLELMPLDFRGVWTDDVATCECGPGGDGQGTGAGNRERLPELRVGPPAQGPALEQGR